MTAPIQKETDMAIRRKKGTFCAPNSFDALISCYSKAALIDALWCACQLGTDGSYEEITTLAARELRIALQTRRDRVYQELVTVADRRIDNDPPD
jgi:hypothetical protein